MLNETLITSTDILHKTLWVCLRFGLVDRCPLSRPISKPWWCLNRSFLHELDRSWSKSLHSKFGILNILLINTHRSWLLSFSSSICTSDRPSVKLGSGTFFIRFDVELDCWSGCVFAFCSFRFRPLLEIFVSASVDFSVCFEFLLFRRFGRNDFGTFALLNFIILSIWVFAIDEASFSVEISIFSLTSWPNASLVKYIEEFYKIEIRWSFHSKYNENSFMSFRANMSGNTWYCVQNPWYRANALVLTMSLPLAQPTHV